MTRAIFVAATGQNVGKTTTSLGIFSGLIKRYGSVGFLKPVGQQHVTLQEGITVDKDVDLFKEHFNISIDAQVMSPVLCTSGFTKSYLDGKINDSQLLEKILDSYRTISATCDYVLVEGTGHVGVGSIFNLNNARVAKALKTEMVIIATGGLGSSIDELALNIEMCKSWNVPIRGVILNKVMDDKRSMIMEYFPKYLHKLGIPLIGCIPYNSFLNTPTIQDFELLFNCSVLCGINHRLRHFKEIRLVAGSLESYLEESKPNQLVITPASREDIIMATVEKHMRTKLIHNQDYESGMILTGQTPPRDELLSRLEGIDIPLLYVPLCSFDAMKKVNSFTAKIRRDDTSKVNKAIQLIEENINFDLLCNRPANHCITQAFA